MRSLVCCVFATLLLPSLFFQSTTEEEEKGLDIIASKMQQLKKELLAFDVYCKGSSRRDIRILRKTASKLNSARAHASDKLSLYSSRAGLAGSTMMLAGLIPSPFSPALLYYGSYLTASSAVGHVSNALVLEESIDFDEVVSVIHNMNDYYEVMVRLTNAYDELLKLQPELVLRGKNGRTLSKEEQEMMLFKIEKLWDLKKELEAKKVIKLSETVDYTNTLIEFLDYIRDWYNTLGGGSAHKPKEIEEYRENQQNAVGLLKQAYGVSKFVKDVSHRSAKQFVTGVMQYGTVQSQSLQKMGALRTAFVGFSSVISVITESSNIEEMTKKIQNRRELIWFFEDVADDLERVCRASPHCVM